MTRFVITGRAKSSIPQLSESDLVDQSAFQAKLNSMCLEIEKIESYGDEVTYYLKESAGPKLLCD